MGQAVRSAPSPGAPGQRGLPRPSVLRALRHTVAGLGRGRPRCRGRRSHEQKGNAGLTGNLGPGSGSVRSWASPSPPWAPVSHLHNRGLDSRLQGALWPGRRIWPLEETRCRTRANTWARGVGGPHLSLRSPALSQDLPCRASGAKQVCPDEYGFGGGVRVGKRILPSPLWAPHHAF